MAVLSLPLSFTNSFWTPDYRKGLEVLFNKLEQVRPRARGGVRLVAECDCVDRASLRMTKLSHLYGCAIVHCGQFCRLR